MLCLGGEPRSPWQAPREVAEALGIIAEGEYGLALGTSSEACTQQMARLRSLRTGGLASSGEHAYRIHARRQRTG